MAKNYKAGKMALNSSILGSLAIVGFIDAFNEEENCRKTLDIVLLTEITFLSGINLGKEDALILLLERSCGFCILGSERLAVSAPGRIEFDHDMLRFGDEVREIRAGEDDDIFFVDGRGGGGVRKIFGFFRVEVREAAFVRVRIERIGIFNDRRRCVVEEGFFEKTEIFVIVKIDVEIGGGSG